jgi:hypothetical protein
VNWSLEFWAWTKWRPESIRLTRKSWITLRASNGTATWRMGCGYSSKTEKSLIVKTRQSKWNRGDDLSRPRRSKFRQRYLVSFHHGSMQCTVSNLQRKVARLKSYSFWKSTISNQWPLRILQYQRANWDCSSSRPHSSSILSHTISEVGAVGFQVPKTHSLFVNRLYTKKVVGLKEEESAILLNFLFDHIKKGQDWHLRVHWRQGQLLCMTTEWLNIRLSVPSLSLPDRAEGPKFCFARFQGRRNKANSKVYAENHATSWKACIFRGSDGHCNREA